MFSGLSSIKKIIPQNLILFYHKIIAALAAVFYGWPSRKLIVIGVTGTSGKSTVVNLIGRILEEAGYKVGWSSTLNFKIAEREWLNETKMTMLGRFALQKLLSQMVKAGCQYAVIEVSSQGIVQSRHLGIDFDVAVFTNLYPEHLEAHGGFEKYRKVKGKLFAKLKPKFQIPKIINKKLIKKISVVNLDDVNAEYFLQFPTDQYYGFTIKNETHLSHLSRIVDIKKLKVVAAKNLKLKVNGSEFMIDDLTFNLNLLGEFNVYNALAAVTVGFSQGISLEISRLALEKIKEIPGRLEEINLGQPFKVFVDYAHTPNELEKVYQVASGIKHPASRIIAVLGAAGGGRDKWKRPTMGSIAAQYSDYVIITNEDPYDENPQKIINQILKGVFKVKKETEKGISVFDILDRQEAIRKAIDLARPNDIIIITGKGCEQYIMGPNNQRIPWDDRRVVREELEKIVG